MADESIFSNAIQAVPFQLISPVIFPVLAAVCVKNVFAIGVQVVPLSVDEYMRLVAAEPITISVVPSYPTAYGTMSASLNPVAVQVCAFVDLRRPPVAAHHQAPFTYLTELIFVIVLPPRTTKEGVHVCPSVDVKISLLDTEPLLFAL